MGFGNIELIFIGEIGFDLIIRLGEDFINKINFLEKNEVEVKIDLLDF